VKPKETSWKDAVLGWMITSRRILKEWDGMMYTNEI
jgi:hypothetical protein